MFHFSPAAPLTHPSAITEKVVTKRQVAGPRPSYTLENVKFETITPIPYDIIKEGLQG
jgi:hypothetical protein